MVTVKTFFIVKLQINLRFPVVKLEIFWMNVFYVLIGSFLLLC